MLEIQTWDISRWASWSIYCKYRSGTNQRDCDIVLVFFWFMKRTEDRALGGSWHLEDKRRKPMRQKKMFSEKPTSIIYKGRSLINESSRVWDREEMTVWRMRIKMTDSRINTIFLASVLLCPHSYPPVFWPTWFLTIKPLTFSQSSL